nr:unnamed protein product [Callosobruchus chinensis]
MSQVYNQVLPVPALEADLLELLEEKLQPTSVHRGLPRCSTPNRKPKYQPVPTSSVQDDHSWFARQLEYTGVAPKLRGSGTRIRGVLSGHLLELLEEKLQPTSVHRGLPRCSTPNRKPKYQPVPTSSVQDDHSWFARQLEYTGVAPKLRGSGTRIRGVLSGHLLELLEEKLQPTSVHRGLPRCSTPTRKPKYQPVPRSSVQDDHSWFARELEYTGVATKLRGSGTRIRGVLSGHLVMYNQD